MVNPERLTDFNRTDEELAELLLFSVCVAGKNANTTSKAVESFLSQKPVNLTIAEWIDDLYHSGLLRSKLMEARIGKYNLVTMFVIDLMFALKNGLNLKTCSIEELEALHGVGPKTARMFLLHTRPNNRLAVLDVHVLKFIRQNLCLNLGTIPKVTPSGKRYLQIENAFLDWYDKRIRAGASCFRVGAGDSYQGTIPNPRLSDGSPDYAGFDLAIWNFYSGNAQNLAS